MSHISTDLFAFLPSKGEMSFSSLDCEAGSGGTDGRKGVHTAEFSDRRCAQRDLRPFWPSRLDDGYLPRSQPCSDCSDRPFAGLRQGAYAAAIGTIFGTFMLPRQIAIGDWLTAFFTADSLAVLFC
jgi:hypothetical protein